jgi:threonylcarbamoyladenosine tRNA methylthiotransferase MtaB
LTLTAAKIPGAAKRRTFHIFTTGCKANQWDSHVIANRLNDAGLVRGDMGTSDLVVINACSLTSRAETDARRFILKARRLNDGAKIVLVGCHAQAYPSRDLGADLLLGQAEKFEAYRYHEGRGSFVTETRDFPIEEMPVGCGQRGRTRFFFKIQDGCNNFCSYCLVPYARGAPRSRSLNDISEAMHTLSDQGVKEVVLTGIDMAAYRDRRSGIDLKGLLRRLEEVKTPPRIRLSSVDPEYIDDAFVTILAESTKLATSIHMPVQSGSEQVLRNMGRRHEPDLVREVVRKLGSKLPGIGIGMDIMVGFPGEGDDAFDETFRLLDDLDISYLHVFPYSPREGTRAAAMEGQIPDGAKKARVRRLKALDTRKRDLFARRFIGEQLTIIPEGKMDRKGLMKGFSQNYLPVYIPFDKRLENNLLEVKIRGMEDGRLIGG